VFETSDFIFAGYFLLAAGFFFLVVIPILIIIFETASSYARRFRTIRVYDDASHFKAVQEILNER